MAKAKFYPSFTKNLSDALRATVEDIDAAFLAVIDSSIFPWPGLTYRRNGELVGSPRDIVDTGDFIRSQSFSFLSALLARFVWSVEYAAIILYGATLENGGIIRARDWIAATRQQVDFEELLAENCRRVFR